MRKLILLSTLLAPTAAFAGGYVIPQVNARDLALASAATADQTGPEALFLNVAELAGLDGFNVSLSGEVLANRTTWSDPNLGSSSLVPQYNTPFSGAISFGHHINHDMAFGIGVGADVPAGGSLVWPNGWQGHEVIQTVKQQVFRLAAGIGFQPVPFVRIGASYVRYQATEELHESLNFLDHEGDGGIALNGGADAFDLGIGIHVPNVPLSLGANYTSTGELNLNGDAHFTNVPPSFTTLLHDQKAHEDLKIPNTFSVGAAYAVQPNITLMAGVQLGRLEGLSHRYVRRQRRLQRHRAAQLSQRARVSRWCRVGPVGLAAADVARRHHPQRVVAIARYVGAVAHRRQQLGAFDRRRLQRHAEAPHRLRVPTRVVRSGHRDRYRGIPGHVRHARRHLLARHHVPR